MNIYVFKLKLAYYSSWIILAQNQEQAWRKLITRIKKETIQLLNRDIICVKTEEDAKKHFQIIQEICPTEKFDFPANGKVEIIY